MGYKRFTDEVLDKYFKARKIGYTIEKCAKLLGMSSAAIRNKKAKGKKQYEEWLKKKKRLKKTRKSLKKS